MTTIKESIVSICGGEDGRRKCDLLINDDRTSICLWRFLNIDDFSAARHFVLSENTPSVIFDVDFLSRHEIIPPMSREKMPPGWEAWSVIKNGNIYVTDKAAFMRSLLTADAFLALPQHRFRSFCEDVKAESSAFGNPIVSVLMSDLIGYSFTMFFCENESSPAACLKHSFLEGTKDEDSRLRGLAFEQLELRAH